MSHLVYCVWISLYFFTAIIREGLIMVYLLFHTQVHVLFAFSKHFPVPSKSGPEEALVDTVWTGGFTPQKKV